MHEENERNLLHDEQDSYSPNSDEVVFENGDTCNLKNSAGKF